MKGILFLAAMLMSSPSWARPYFRFLDIRHPQTSAGMFLDPTSGVKDFGAMLALVTHSPADGSITGSNIVWTPLSIGGGGGDSSTFVALGPSANVSPLFKALARRGLEYMTKAGNYTSLKDFLTPKQDDSPDITFSAGPSFLFNVVEDGAFIEPKKWRLQTRLFLGAAWKF